MHESLPYLWWCSETQLGIEPHRGMGRRSFGKREYWVPYDAVLPGWKELGWNDRSLSYGPHYEVVCTLLVLCHDQASRTPASSSRY